MITVKKKNSQKAEICWETGEDYKFLQLLNEVIKTRNTDKQYIIGLKEEYI